MGTHAQALLAALDTACTNVDDLGQASAALFQTHPDHAVITSFPGLADSTGARVLAEIGDDKTRFADARALKAYAGSAPITRGSGKRGYVGRRHGKNDRLVHVGYLWALPLCEYPRAHTPIRPDESRATGTPPPFATSSTGC